MNTLVCRRTLAYLAAVRCARRSRRLPPHLRRPIDAKNLAVFANLPLRERVADRLSDALLAIDESLAMCEMESEAARDSSWIEPHLQSLYDGVNAVLNSISD